MIRDEKREHNNVMWVKAFKIIFNLWEGYNNKSFGDIILTLQKYFQISLSKIEINQIYSIYEFLKELFIDIRSDTLTVDIIEKFNSLILQKKNTILKNLFGINDIGIYIFSEYDKEDLKQNVKCLKWNTSYCLFNEVFCENSKYMTVH